jgi:fermentation-respiration switch protein FrsA (DUF1100 family)
MIYIATTGYKPATDRDPYVKTGYYTNEPRGGLCDSAAAFSSGPSSNQLHMWVNYTGCDSLYGVLVTATAVYVTGHNRWLDNPFGHDSAGAGAYEVDSVGAIDPATGRAIRTWNARPTARGHGKEDLTAFAGGLLVGCDTAQIHGEYHKGTALLPLP